VSDARIALRACAGWALAACAFAFTPTSLAVVQGALLDPAPYVRNLIPDAQIVGGGRLTWFGLHAYDAALYSANARYVEGAPFALQLTYARKFKGALIAERSIAEIRRLDLAQEQELANWQGILGGLFPDVAPGDRLTGVSLGNGHLRFFHNGRELGTITNEQLRRAFFSIWLDPRTSAPDLRRKLLGDAGRR
jgi:hypothetical protein